MRAYTIGNPKKRGSDKQGGKVEEQCLVADVERSGKLSLLQSENG